MSYRYTVEPGAAYETVSLAGSHNRLINLPSTSGASITTPQVFFRDNPPTDITNLVTFQVDLAQQINTGAFVPGTSSAYARGLLNAWNAAMAQTNDPSYSQDQSVWSGHFQRVCHDLQISGSPGPDHGLQVLH